MRAAVRTRPREPSPGLVKAAQLRAPLACRRKFLRYFHEGFRDETYVAWERGYKAEAHRRWEETLDARTMRELVRTRRQRELATRAVAIESRTHLLFSFEKMAVRDAVRPDDGARSFADGLVELTHGRGSLERRFEDWCSVVEALPRPGSRVFTWPVVTVFGFLARPDEQFFFKPNVTRRAAAAYGAEISYASRPNWATYASVLAFVSRVRTDLASLEPKDMIDLQSFLWVLGSDEYP